MSWLYDLPDPATNYALGDVYFIADRSFYFMEYDDNYNLMEGLQADGSANNAITWSAVDPMNTPEPATYLMLIAGIVGLLALSGFEQKSRV